MVLYVGRSYIYAQIPESEVEHLGSQLLLDEVYTIRKFNVRISKTNYVPFDAELMIQMTSFTTITPSKVSVNAFPKLIYNMTPFNDIRTTGDSANKYIGLFCYPSETLQLLTYSCPS